MNEKENESLDTKTETPEDNQSNTTQYHIYDYFKKHSSAFFTITSTFIAIISLVLNFSAFISINSYLIYFKVDSLIYKSSTSFLYLMAIVLIFSTIMILFQGFLSKTFENYSPYKRLLFLCKYYLKKMKNDLDQGKKVRATLQKSLNKIPDILSKNEKKQELQKQLEYLNASAEEIENNIKLMRKDVRKCCIKYYILISLSCIVAWFVLSVVSTLMLSVSLYEWNKILPSAMIFSAVYVLIIALEYWFLSCVLRLNKKKIISDAEQDDEIMLSMYRDLPEFPINLLFDGNFKSFFSDSNCKKFVATMIGCLAIVVFTSSWAGSKTAKTQKEFFVVNSDGQAYVLIYNNGECAILEKAEIIGDDIIIDTTHQKIISLIDIDMYRYEFNHVEIIRTKRNNVISSIESTEGTDNTESTENTEITETLDKYETVETEDILEVNK